jgi:glycosyltransferase involved in cell wall biosynthesis
MALLLHLLTRQSYSLTYHGPALATYGPFQRDKWQHAQFVIVVSEKLRKEAERELPDFPDDRVDVVPMGVDLALFRRSKPYTPPSVGAACEMVTCGRLHVHKGHRDVILATELLRAQGIDARLTVLGEGPDRPFLEYLIRQSPARPFLRLAGAVSEEAVRDALENAHVFVLASHDEAIGVATMEAMAMELPVVVTDVGGVSELVSDGEEGLLVPPKSPGALAAAVSRLVAYPEAARAMGRAGTEKVRARFSSRHSAATIARRLRVIIPDGAEELRRPRPCE